MANILKISEAASLALHTMVILASDPKEKFTTDQVAEMIQASKNHLSKVLQRLSKVGLVKSIRGPKGGFVIAKDPGTITLLEVFETIEGPIDADSCLLGDPVCKGGCILGNVVHNINKQFKDQLAGAYLKDLVYAFPLLSDNEIAAG